LLSLFIIKNNLGELFFHFVIDQLSVFDEVHKLRENSVVIDDFGQLREVPREPLLQAHAEGVDVLVQLLDQGNGLNNGFVLPVHVGRALLSRERVTQSQLGASHVFVFNFLHDLDEMSLHSSHQL